VYFVVSCSKISSCPVDNWRLAGTCMYVYLYGTIYISTKFRPDRTSNMATRWPSWKSN
jgi:hypothetical protein